MESGEGVDRAGGFAVQVGCSTSVSTPVLTGSTGQGLGGVLIRKVDGDYQNVVGFPAASFFKFLEQLCDEEEDFLEI